MSVAAAMSAPEYDDIRGGTIEQFTVDQNVSYGVARKNQVYKYAPPVSNRPKFGRLEKIMIVHMVVLSFLLVASVALVAATFAESNEAKKEIHYLRKELKYIIREVLCKNETKDISESKTMMQQHPTTLPDLNLLTTTTIQRFN